MIRRKRFGTTGLSAVLATMLCIGMEGASAAIEAPGSSSPAASDAQQPIEQLEQLDEIVVRGKSLARDISDAEDDFFKLYNQLNSNDDYEIVCGDMRVNGSLILRRVCVPGFVADRVPSYAGSSYPGNFVGAHTPGCSSVQGMNFNYDGSVSPIFAGAGCSQPMAVSYIAGPRTSGPVSLNKREAYLQNVLQVINSDPRLVAKVRNLDSLYREMKQVRGRMVKVRRTDLMVTDTRRLRPR